MYPNIYTIFIGSPNIGKTAAKQLTHTMFTQDKRTPALTDLDPMPFGKHKGVLMQDVPAEYMAYMRDKIGKVVQPDSELAFKALPEHKRHMLLFMNYIHNSWDAISQEIGDENE